MWAWVATNLPYNIVFGNKILAGCADIDLINHVINFKPKPEDLMATHTTTATKINMYRSYTVEKHNRDITNIKSRSMDTMLQKVVIEHIWKFREINKDKWEPCLFPVYQINCSY
eukprot:TRINITY_DN22612_c0_g1_i1.p1 TRINITY_DN22612_c0_g1~~TRINITY_DN22612_c0_g1_i1.p1  ORF type:complete len:114 (-),score=17.87 TRINITY_DN22612_c0_g1_i1:76-417(-)